MDEQRNSAESPQEDAALHLVRAAQAGDVASFSLLYEDIAPALHGWAELRLRPAMRTHFDPQDLVQEVWFRAWSAIERFDERRSLFRMWVFRIAKNVLLEAFRSLREPTPNAGSPGPTTRLFALRNLPDSATAISGRLARSETLAAFTDLVRELPEEDQKLVLHCGLEGLGYREVAERLNISSDAVAKRWQRLRARLAERGTPEKLFA